MKEKLSIVIPCYCSEINISKVINDDIEVFRKDNIDNYEFILVNDASPDNTWDKLKQLAQENRHVTAVNLSRNFGQHGAIMAGFQYVSGDYIVVSDDDGQTPMESIREMLDLMDDGYDVIMTDRGEGEQHSLLRRFGTMINDLSSRLFLDNKDNIPMSIFFMAKRFIIEEVKKYNNPYPYVSGLVFRATNNIGVVTVDQHKRQSGQSGYSMKKMLKLWINGFTSFSSKPLRMSSYLGVLVAILGLIYGLYILIRKLIMNNIVVGWSSTAALILFMSGMILFVLGMIGEYVGRIYICINNAPQFVVREVLSEEREESL